MRIHLLRSLAAPPAAHVLLLHDDRCTPARCVCEPEVVIRPLTPEAIAEGEQLERAWKAGAL